MRYWCRKVFLHPPDIKNDLFVDLFAIVLKSISHYMQFEINSQHQWLKGLASIICLFGCCRLRRLFLQQGWFSWRSATLAMSILFFVCPPSFVLFLDKGKQKCFPTSDLKLAAASVLSDFVTQFSLTRPGIHHEMTRAQESTEKVVPHGSALHYFMAKKMTLFGQNS